MAGTFSCHDDAQQQGDHATSTIVINPNMAFEPIEAAILTLEGANTQTHTLGHNTSEFNRMRLIIICYARANNNVALPTS